MLALDLIERLEFQQAGSQLHLLGAFSPFLPSRVGHNRSLDAALRCLLHAHRVVLCNEVSTAGEALHSYTDALSLIRNDLNIHGAKTSSETVCAALNMCSYKIIRSHGGPQWMAHAGGVSAIIQAWGPERIVSGFDLSIAASHYGSIVSTCICAEKDCFLVSPTWDEVRAKCVPVSPSLDEYSMDCLTAWATLPPLLRDIRMALSSNFGGFDSRGTLLLRAHRFKTLVKRHAATYESGLRDPAVAVEVISFKSKLETTKYEFNSRLIAFRFSLYWASIIIANTCLARLGEFDYSLDEESREAAEGIYKSTEYLNSFKPFGILWTATTLSAAYGVSSPERRMLIVDAAQDLLSLLPFKIGPAMFQYNFNLFTGGVV